MAHLECDFLAPSRVGDRLKFRLEVEKIGNSSMTLAVAASHGGVVRIRARLVVVLTSIDTGKPQPIAGDLRERFARFLAPSGGAVTAGARETQASLRSRHSHSGVRTISCTRFRARTSMKQRTAKRCTIPPCQRCRRQHIYD